MPSKRKYYAAYRTIAEDLHEAHMEEPICAASWKEAQEIADTLGVGIVRHGRLLTSIDEDTGESVHFDNNGNETNVDTDDIEPTPPWKTENVGHVTKDYLRQLSSWDLICLEALVSMERNRREDIAGGMLPKDDGHDN